MKIIKQIMKPEFCTTCTNDECVIKFMTLFYVPIHNTDIILCIHR